MIAGAAAYGKTVFHPSHFLTLVDIHGRQPDVNGSFSLIAELAKAGRKFD